MYFDTEMCFSRYLLSFVS